jgi:signal transduction histidine kinase
MLNAIKQLQVDKRIRVGYGAAFMLLLISYLLTLYTNRQLMEQTKTITHTNNIIAHLENLISSVKDAETGMRGYFIMNNEQFLEPYITSSKKVDSTFYLLKLSVANNKAKQLNLDTLKILINKKYNYLQFEKRYHTRNNFQMTDSMLIMINESKTVMDSIRIMVKKMQTNEKNLLVKKTIELRSRYNSLTIFIIISLILAFLFAFFGLITYIRENRARKTADKKVLEYQQLLQLRIEELNNANKELIQMRRHEKFAATGRIARRIAHEVRNPLTNIDLAIGQIKSEMNYVDENANMLFGMVSRNSKRINQLITELLNATRFSELNYQPVSVNTIIDDALELAKDRIALANIHIEKNYSSHMCDISADAEKLKIAFLNIIVNAVEAIEGEGGLIKIVTKTEESTCVVEISDNGVGMDEAALGKLFEPYFTTKQKGNGLGLANTQNIILNHKGNIHVESTPGKGSTFIIKFDF